MLTKIYVGLWSKYRPAILKMMVDADLTPQAYQLSHHEFHAFNNRRKGSLTFSLKLSNGQVAHGLKNSPIAQDLWEILKVSRTAGELTSKAVFHFSLDSRFVLHIQKDQLK